MAGRPSKPVAVIKAEGKSHRTKAELEAREKGEAEFATGVLLQEKPEVKNNLVAHREFERIVELFTILGKNDALYENIINRYCMIYAECREFEEKREKFYQDLWKMEEEKDDGLFGDKVSTYYKLRTEMQKNIINLDKQVQDKRKMMMAIEKENIMTLAAALRNVPKQEESGGNPLIALLGGAAK